MRSACWKSFAECEPHEIGDKETELRYSIGGKFEGSELSRFQGRKKPEVFRGRVQDISEGGFCLLAARRPEQSVLLQGLLRVAQMPMKIPTFAQVRWVHRQPRGPRYRIGLQYLI